MYVSLAFACRGGFYQGRGEMPRRKAGTIYTLPCSMTAEVTIRGGFPRRVKWYEVQFP